MFKLSQEEINKMKEEVKELRKKIDKLEWFIKMNEYDPNEHKVYKGDSDLDLHLNYDNKTQEETPCDGRAVKIKDYQSFYNAQRNTVLDKLEPPFECCKNCPNNFKNNPSGGGVCSCDLPYQEIFKW